MKNLIARTLITLPITFCLISPLTLTNSMYSSYFGISSAAADQPLPDHTPDHTPDHHDADHHDAEHHDIHHHDADHHDADHHDVDHHDIHHHGVWVEGHWTGVLFWRHWVPGHYE